MRVIALSLVLALTIGNVAYAANTANYKDYGVLSGVMAYHPIEESSVAEANITVEDIAIVPVQDEVASEWSDKLMADVDEFMNVRTEPSAESKLAGKLRKGDLAQIIGDEGDWYKISSGNLEGYVSKEFCVIGLDAKALSEEVCKRYAVSNTGGLRIREDKDLESDVVAVIAEQEKVKLDGEAYDLDPDAEWIAVKHEDGEGFVSAEYVTIETAYGKGITVAEEEEAYLKAIAAKKSSSGHKKGSSVSASVDDVTYLAALIQAEAGVSNYEGLLAVGAVVVNRMKRGYAGGSLRGVITQPGQFPPATNGIVDGILSRGVAASCVRAANEALSGVDNTGGAVGFKSAKSGQSGVVIGGNVFF